MKLKLSILFWLIAISSLVYPAVAEDTPEFEPLHILNIQYDYTMDKSENSGKWTASGPLVITLEENVDSCYIIYTNNRHHHYPDYFLGKIIFRDIDDGIYWRKVYNSTIFFIYGVVNDKYVYKSDKIYVDDYISEEDLNLIYKRTSVELIADDNIGIIIDNDTLINSSDEQITLAIYDFRGTKLLSKQLKSCETINLIDYRNRDLIVSYSFKGQSFIKKLYIP
ncbi:MAG: hypothetical protein K2H61_06930 [Muribaculaceae bacterium]|nr:hypothetical protein [Muribaculaceae bacterium]